MFDQIQPQTREEAGGASRRSGQYGLIRRAPRDDEVDRVGAGAFFERPPGTDHFRAPINFREFTAKTNNADFALHRPFNGRRNTEQMRSHRSNQDYDTRH